MKEFRRSLPTDVAVTGRTLEGLALAWDRRYRVSDDAGKTFYVEGWRKRAFENGLRATGNIHEVRIDHRDVRVGRVSFAEASEGLTFTATVDGTPHGDAVLEHADAGRFRGVSLCYGSDQQKRGTDGTIWRTRAVARELSLIDAGVPQYEDAVITARRGLWVVDADEADRAEALAITELLDRCAQLIAIDVNSL